MPWCQRHCRDLFTHVYVEHIEFLWIAVTVKAVKRLSRITKMNSPEKLVTELEIVIFIVTHERNSLALLLATHSITHFGVIYSSVKIAIQLYRGSSPSGHPKVPGQYCCITSKACNKSVRYRLFYQ